MDRADRLLRASSVIARCGHGAARRALQMSEHGRALAALACCLRYAPAGGAIASPEWVHVLKIANDHLLTPALWSALGNSGHAAPLPADAGEYLATLHRLNGDRNRALRRQ